MLCNMKKQLILEKPCSENWSEMAATSATCRFCQSCQKEVIDFTQKSGREIVRVLENQQNVCGRFTKEQLEREYVIPTQRKSLKYLAWTSAFSGMLISTSVFGNAKSTIYKNKSVQTERKSILSQKSEKANDPETRTITGTVTDENGNPLSGVRIVIKDTPRETVSNEEGKYSIGVSTKEAAILIFIYNGYSEVMFVGIHDTIDMTFDIKQIEFEKSFTGIVGGVGLIHSSKGKYRRSLWQRIKNFPRWITSPFRKKSE